MRSGMKMLMLANRGGSGGRNEGGSGGQNEMRNGMEMRRGGAGGRNEMEMGYGAQSEMEMRRGGSGGRNEMEMRRGSGGRSEMEMRRGGSGGRNEMEMGYGGSEMRRGGSGGRNEMEMGYGSEMAYGRSEGGSGSRNEMRGGYGETRGNYSGMNNRSNYARNEYENEMRDMDARFRGGERSNYNPYGEQMMEETESRRRFPRRRDGTFAPRSEMEMGYPFIPPIYEREGGGQMNLIGFERGNEMPSNYGMRAEHHKMDEMQQRGGQMQMGRGSHEMKLTKEMAEEWMMGLQNEDGTKGPHWSMDQAKQVMQQRGIKAPVVDFWVALNIIYSDYSAVMRKHGIGDRVDAYSDFAAAFINDRDAEPEKLALYYECIVKK